MDYILTDTQYYQAIADAIRDKKAEIIEKQKRLVSLALTSAPTKTIYFNDETWDLTGLIVTATYDDGTTSNVTNDCVMTYPDGTELDSGIMSDTFENVISYTRKGVTKTVSYNFTVRANLLSISNISNQTTSYVTGDLLDLSGTVVTGLFDTGEIDITNDCVFSPSSGTELTTIGVQTVTVSIDWYGQTATSSFDIEVADSDPYASITWANGTDAQIASMVAAADRGEIDLTDYWHVGDERVVHLSAMPATNVTETHAEQDVVLVLMQADTGVMDNENPCYNYLYLTEYLDDGVVRNYPSFIVGQKNGLIESGNMNNTKTNDGGIGYASRRQWLNQEYRNSLPETLRGIFKNVMVKYAAQPDSTSISFANNYFFFPAEYEVFGHQSFCADVELRYLSQWEYYKTEANRIKTDGTSAKTWWERSVYFGDSKSFCTVYSRGYSTGMRLESMAEADANMAFAPCGCI